MRLPPRVGEECERITEPLYHAYWARYTNDGVQAAVGWFATLRPGVRNLFAAHACQMAAIDGSLSLFYATSSGTLAHEAVDGLRALGLPRCASLVAEANRFFGPTVPRDHETRIRLIESGGIFSDGHVDRSLCRIGHRDVAHSPDWEYRRVWDFSELDCLLQAAFEEEAPNGFLAVADAYACLLAAGSSAAADWDRPVGPGQ